ncbi:MAG: hypothetical protein KJ645_10820 [Planctomycetes bacterium]|nr:hypothetical protein [Planctomycetota bacterium]
MSTDWIAQLLRESRGVVEEKHRFVSGDTQWNLPLEKQCVILLSAFEETGEVRFFQGVYTLTQPLFTWFAEKQAKEAGIKGEVEELTNRMYSVLCESIHFPGFVLPVDNLFDWCFALIENLVDEAKRRVHTKEDNASNGLASLCPSTTEAYMRSSRLEEPDRIEEHLTGAWYGHGAELSPLEREAITLYHKEGMNLKELANKMDLSPERAESLLSISRLKLLQALHQKEVGHLAMDAMDKEKPS